MKNNDEIKKAIYDYGVSMAKDMDSDDVDLDDKESVDAAVDEMWETSYCYAESFEHVLDKLEEGLGDRYNDLNKELDLDSEFNKGFIEGMKQK